MENVIGDQDGALGSFIASVLPNLHGQQQVMEALKTLGVDTLEDMKYIQEKDLLGVLRPVEARKIIANIKAAIATEDSMSIDIIPSAIPKSPSSADTVILQSPSTPRSRASTPQTPSSDSISSNFGGQSPSNSSVANASSVLSTPCGPEDNDWHLKFKIPWEKMTTEIIRKLNSGQRPGKSERLEIIRIVVSEVLSVCAAPRKRHLHEVGRKMAMKYPVAFKDNIDGDVVASGYDYITKQLMSKVDNLKRGSTPLALKRQASSSTEMDHSPAKHLRLDSYGCINWLPDRPPQRETAETQKLMQNQLKRMYMDKSNDIESIEKKMETTFYTQRKEIVAGMEVGDLAKEWPYIFHVSGMRIHFKLLTGVDMNKESVVRKCERVVAYLKSHGKKENMAILAEMNVTQAKLPEANIPLSLLLLLSHFNEDEECMFHKVDETCLASEVDCAKLPNTPCIIICGTSPLTAKFFMVSVDRTIVKDCITNFCDALFLMFGAYYALNICYPATLATTLEFIQRCFLKINPDKGSKVEKKAPKICVVSPKVLSLISKMADFEWM